MKRQLYKILLSSVRALVFAKRFLVWLFKQFGHIFLWIGKPVFTFAIVPFYGWTRTLSRKYNEISENPWDRRKAVLLSTPALSLVALLFFASFAAAAVSASNEPGVVPGAKSILLTRLVSSGEIDWSAEEEPEPTEPTESLIGQQGVVFSGGGAVAYVFPFSDKRFGEKLVPQAVETAEPEKQQKPALQKYAVQKRDTLAAIAKKFNLRIETLLWANNITERTILRPGDVLVVPSVDGVVYTIKRGDTFAALAKIFGSDIDKIAVANALSAKQSLKVGTQLVIPGSRPLVAAKKSTQVARSPVEPKQQPEQQGGQETQSPASEIPETSETQQPQDEVSLEPEPSQPPPVPVVKRPPPSEAIGKLIWPTTSHAMTQYFSGRHPGVDISGDYSTPIYAIDDGTVVQSGWNNTGYGNMVLIDHGNGMQSRYAHASRVFVSIGQQVTKGDTIGTVGTTGRSTGLHLHFEIYMNGKRVNPFKYVR